MSGINMKMYVLVAIAHYDHGVIGVYSSEELARWEAEKIWPKTDGHHYFRIDVVTLDETYDDVFQHKSYPAVATVPIDSEAPIEVSRRSERA